MNTVPTVPGENGNSDTFSLSGNPCKVYDGVINNYTAFEYEQVCQVLGIKAVKYIVAKEIGTSGTPHLQIYMNLKKKERITAIHKWLGFQRISMRKCRNEEALIEYCKKDGDFVSGGFPKPIRIIHELRDWQQKIVDLCLTKPDDRKVYWFWEDKGNIGKSAFTKYMVVKYNALFCDGGKKADLINLVFNNDMDKTNVVIFDIPRPSKGHVSYSTLEAIKNGLVCNTKYETGVKAFNPPHIICFANFPPEEPEQLSADRWVVEELTLRSRALPLFMNPHVA